MSVPVKFSDTPPHYDGYWPVINNKLDTITFLIRVKSGRMYLCTSIPENTLPGRFIIDSFDDSVWVNASVINNREYFDFIKYSYLYTSWCILTIQDKRLSIFNDGETYPLYWRRTNMAELKLLKLFTDTPL